MNADVWVSEISYITLLVKQENRSAFRRPIFTDASLTTTIAIATNLNWPLALHQVLWQRLLVAYRHSNSYKQVSLGTEQLFY